MSSIQFTPEHVQFIGHLLAQLKFNCTEQEDTILFLEKTFKFSSELLTQGFTTQDQFNIKFTDNNKEALKLQKQQEKEAQKEALKLQKQQEKQAQKEALKLQKQQEKQAQKEALKLQKQQEKEAQKEALKLQKQQEKQAQKEAQ